MSHYALLQSLQFQFSQYTHMATLMHMIFADEHELPAAEFGISKQSAERLFPHQKWYSGMAIRHKGGPIRHNQITPETHGF
jgi:hypothetical protein